MKAAPEQQIGDEAHHRQEKQHQYQAMVEAGLLRSAKMTRRMATSSKSEKTMNNMNVKDMCASA